MNAILQTVARPCPVPKCDAGRKFEHAMCLRHWRLVPKELKMRIWKTSEGRHWQEWGEAMKEAIAAITLKVADSREAAKHA